MRTLLLLFLLATSYYSYCQWIQQGPKLYGTGAEGPVRAGSSVTISGDGNTAVLTSPELNGSNGGFHVFKWSGSSWQYQSTIMGNTYARMGYHVTLSANGKTLAVSSEVIYGVNQHKDSVWVYIYNGAQWTRQFGAGTGGAQIRVALSADGNTMLCGTKVWVRSNTLWALQATLAPNDATFGSAFADNAGVALSADGNTAFVGDTRDNSNLGACWVFVRLGTTWTQEGNKLVGNGFVGSGPVRQGWNVSISGDGTTATAVSQDPSFARGVAVFRKQGNIWLQEAELQDSDSDRIGWGASLSYDGNNLVCGSDNSRKSWVFQRSGGNWLQLGSALQASPIGNSSYFFGRSNSIDSSGTKLLVGDFGAFGWKGAAWYFHRSGNSWSQSGSYLQISASTGCANQGRAVKISKDGSTMVTSGNSEGGSGHGAVWPFAKNGADLVYQLLKIQ
jgi:hypothetical protein